MLPEPLKRATIYGLQLMKEEKFLTVKDVMRILGAGERSVFRYIHSGRLKAAKIGYWRIREQDLKEFIEKSFNTRKKK
jgi:excisionase family DNA binding protein